jgi:hypothetical protein
MCYEATIASAGGVEATLTKSLIISLEDAAANWFSRLPPKCIYSWQQLKERFLLNFQGFQVELDTKEDFFLAPSAKRKHFPTFSEGFYSSRLKLQKYPMTKSLHKPSKHCGWGLCIVIKLESGPK